MKINSARHKVRIIIIPIFIDENLKWRKFKCFSLGTSIVVKQMGCELRQSCFTICAVSNCTRLPLISHHDQLGYEYVDPGWHPVTFIHFVKNIIKAFLTLLLKSWGIGDTMIIMLFKNETGIAVLVISDHFFWICFLMRDEHFWTKNDHKDKDMDVSEELRGADCLPAPLCPPLLVSYPGSIQNPVMWIILGSTQVKFFHQPGSEDLD